MRFPKNFLFKYPAFWQFKKFLTAPAVYLLQLLTALKLKLIFRVWTNQSVIFIFIKLFKTNNRTYCVLKSKAHLFSVSCQILTRNTRRVLYFNDISQKIMFIFAHICQTSSSTLLHSNATVIIRNNQCPFIESFYYNWNYELINNGAVLIRRLLKGNELEVCGFHLEKDCDNACVCNIYTIYIFLVGICHFWRRPYVLIW